MSDPLVIYDPFVLFFHSLLNLLIFMRFSVPRSQNTDPLIQSLSEPFVISSIRYPIHSLSDPFVIWSIPYRIHSLSNTFVIPSIRYLIHPLYNPFVIRSIRYPIHTLSDPYAIKWLRSPLTCQGKLLRISFAKQNYTYSFT